MTELRLTDSKARELDAKADRLRARGDHYDAAMARQDATRAQIKADRARATAEFEACEAARPAESAVSLPRELEAADAAGRGHEAEAGQ